MSKEKLYKISFGLLFLLFSCIILYVANHHQEMQSQTLGEQLNPTPAVSAPSIPFQVPSRSMVLPSTGHIAPPGLQEKVNRVIDGDTIEVIINGQKQKVRFIGINTPETVDPRKPVECFGKEASTYAKQLLSNKIIYLQSDPTQGNLDKYHRLLRYVWLDTSTNVNKLMIADGYAYEYTYNKPYKYQAAFKSAQRDAENAGRGLWAANTCNGKK